MKPAGGLSNGVKTFNAKATGRPSIIRGAKYQRGFVIDPQQILSLLHDTHPELPIPNDAKHEGIGIHDAGINSFVEFYFSSVIAPSEFCLQLKPNLFFKMLANLSDGMIPTDAELDGIEISTRWTYVMLRVSSAHWPPARQDDHLPMVHLRYDSGELYLVDMTQAFQTNERRIRIQ